MFKPAREARGALVRLVANESEVVVPVGAEVVVGVHVLPVMCDREERVENHRWVSCFGFSDDVCEELRMITPSDFSVLGELDDEDLRGLGTLGIGSNFA